MNSTNTHPTEKEQQYSYMLLDRLKMDCNYFLGHGHRNTDRLWSGNVKDHISDMKELYNSLTVKPQWISMDDINQFEAKMTQDKP